MSGMMSMMKGMGITMDGMSDMMKDASMKNRKRRFY
jgi:hypothetical protein